MTQQKLKDFALGVLLTVSLFVPYMLNNGVFVGVPYSNVRVDTLMRTSPETVLVNTTFIETDQCAFVAMDVFTEHLGTWRPIPWEIVSGHPAERFRGMNSMSMIINTAANYEEIEIRMRHRCRGKRRDTLFLKFDGV